MCIRDRIDLFGFFDYAFTQQSDNSGFLFAYQNMTGEGRYNREIDLVTVNYGNGGFGKNKIPLSESFVLGDKKKVMSAKPGHALTVHFTRSEGLLELKLKKISDSE